MSDSNDDLILIEEDTLESGEVHAPDQAWQVLIVDDEPLVHEATSFALRDTVILGKPFATHSVYSAEQARAFLREFGEPAIILLDVVMETDSAGLDLVSDIRHEFAFQNVRIILRTGQPGYAPELEVVTEYDINDYRSKSELTRNRLLTSVTAALRSYQQLLQLDQSYRGLQQVIAASENLITAVGFQQFTCGILEQLSVFLAPEGGEGLVVVSLPDSADEALGVAIDSNTIVAATGKYAPLLNHKISDAPDELDQAAISRATQLTDNEFTPSHAVIRCSGKQLNLVVYVKTHQMVSDSKIDLLKIFSQNIGLMANNLHLIERLSQAAYFNSATLLPNGLSLTEQLDQLSEAERRQRCFVMLNIDNFSALQETLEDETVNQLLQEFARHIMASEIGCDCLAHISGDCFGLIIDAAHFAAVNTHCCSAELRVGVLPFNISATGVAIRLSSSAYPGDQIVRSAFRFMAEAKKQARRQISSFDIGVMRNYSENAALIQSLIKTIGTSDLKMVYQPKWSLPDRAFSGVEALVRWQTEDGEWISPEKFIPLVESSGLSDDLFRWILEQTLIDYSDLLAKGVIDGQLAVNMSSIHLRDPKIQQKIAELIAKYGVTPSALTLEITESLMLDGGPEAAIATIESLRDLGCRIAIDDFGTGYSSYAYLTDLPVDQVKLDRSLVQKVTSNRGYSVVASICLLCRDLGLEIVAEGVETSAEVEVLTGLQVDKIQGFYFAKPMSPADLESFLADPSRS